MKRICLLLFFSSFLSEGFCQSYITTGFTSYFPRSGYSPGLELNIGYIFKDKESRKRNYMVGVGANIELLNSKIPYIPIYAQAGYFNSFDKVTPYVLVKVGYGIYNANGSPIKEDSSNLKGGIFMDVRAGLGWQLNKSKSIAPFIGLSYVMFQPKNETKNGMDYYKAIINAGIVMIIF